MSWFIANILAHHEVHDQPFCLLLVAATLVAVAALVMRRNNG